MAPMKAPEPKAEEPKVEVKPEPKPEPAPKMLKVKLLKGYWPSTTPGKEAKKGAEIIIPMDEAMALLNAPVPLAVRADKITPEDV